MTIKEIEEKAEDIWIRNNPSEIASFNTEKIEFVKAFVEGFKCGSIEYRENLLAKLTSNKESEYPSILKNLKKELKNNPTSFVDTVKDFQIIEALEFSLTVQEFCNIIDLYPSSEI
jgi:hypothetical protein